MNKSIATINTVNFPLGYTNYMVAYNFLVDPDLQDKFKEQYPFIKMDINTATANFILWSLQLYQKSPSGMVKFDNFDFFDETKKAQKRLSFKDVKNIYILNDDLMDLMDYGITPNMIFHTELEFINLEESPLNVFNTSGTTAMFLYAFRDTLTHYKYDDIVPFDNKSLYQFVLDTIINGDKTLCEEKSEVAMSQIYFNLQEIMDLSNTYANQKNMLQQDYICRKNGIDIR